MKVRIGIRIRSRLDYLGLKRVRYEIGVMGATAVSRMMMMMMMTTRWMTRRMMLLLLLTRHWFQMLLLMTMMMTMFCSQSSLSFDRATMVASHHGDGIRKDKHNKKRQTQ